MVWFGVGVRGTSKSAICLRMDVIDVMENYNWLCLSDGLCS